MHTPPPKPELEFDATPKPESEFGAPPQTENYACNRDSFSIFIFQALLDEKNILQERIIERYCFLQLILWPLRLSPNVRLNRSMVSMYGYHKGEPCVYHIPTVYEATHYVLTDNNMETHFHARMPEKLQFLSYMYSNLHSSICTTLLYKILFAKSKNIYLFSFYSTKCPPRINFKNAKLSQMFSCTGYGLTGGRSEKHA